MLELKPGDCFVVKTDSVGGRGHQLGPGPLVAGQPRRVQPRGDCCLSRWDHLREPEADRPLFSRPVCRQPNPDRALRGDDPRALLVRLRPGQTLRRQDLPLLAAAASPDQRGEVHPLVLPRVLGADGPLPERFRDHAQHGLGDNTRRLGGSRMPMGSRLSTCPPSLVPTLKTPLSSETENIHISRRILSTICYPKTAASANQADIPAEFKLPMHNSTVRRGHPPLRDYRIALISLAL